MRRAARGTLRTAALGGWAALTLAALPAASGVAMAADGNGQGATDGPPVLHQQPVGDARGGFRGDEPRDAGDRHENHGERFEHGHPAHSERPAAPAPVVQPAVLPAGDPAPAGQPAVEQTSAGTPPRIDIGTALGPIAGGAGGAAARASASAEQAANAASRTPLLSIDAPSPFAPRRISGELRDAPGAVTVQLAIRRGAPGRRCAWWSARAARFTAARNGGCQAAHWLNGRVLRGARGLRWRVELGGPLPTGSYRYLVRVMDAAGRPVAFDRV